MHQPRQQKMYCKNQQAQCHQICCNSLKKRRRRWKSKISQPADKAPEDQQRPCDVVTDDRACRTCADLFGHFGIPTQKFSYAQALTMIVPPMIQAAPGRSRYFSRFAAPEASARKATPPAPNTWNQHLRMLVPTHVSPKFNIRAGNRIYSHSANSGSYLLDEHRSGTERRAFINSDVPSPHPFRTASPARRRLARASPAGAAARPSAL